LKGDLPFFVSRDSADCWSVQKYFKLNFSSGAPPDLFSLWGQGWGMPPYNFEEILKDNFLYFKKRLKYAQNFYDLFRIDHVLGFLGSGQFQLGLLLKSKEE
jgi:4-alpha-glucanotransferase